MKAFVVAEIGSNWEGSLSKGKRIIKECKKAGADAVKFQMWRANDLYEDSHPNWKEIKKSELTFEKTRKFKEYCDEQKIEFFCSAFYPEAIEFLDSVNVKRHKIASRTCTFNDPYSVETITKISDSRKPVIISMGMGGNKNRIRKILKKNKITFCYCISEYPTDLRKVNWKKLEKYDGFSDHTLGITAPLIFTVIKKRKNTSDIFIEKHVKLKNSKGPDASSSINTDELKTMVEQIRIIEKAIGNEDRIISNEEKETLKVARKSIVSTRTLMVGDIIKRTDVCFKRPGTGFLPIDIHKVVGKKIIVEIPKDSVIKKEFLS